MMPKFSMPKKRLSMMMPTSSTANQHCRVACGTLVLLGIVLASIGSQSLSIHAPNLLPSLNDTRMHHYALSRGGVRTPFHDNDEEDKDDKTMQQPLRYSKHQLRLMFTSHIETQVQFNNWDLGCNDLQFVSPYLKAIADRLFKDKMERKVIIDVGANNGDDTISIQGSFRPIQGMCGGFSTPFLLLSVEPSPKVFCELTQVMQKYPPSQEVHLLNVALSNEIGNHIFNDPGNEGG
jgi:hypothetical protein